LGVAGWSSVQAQTGEHPRHFIAQCLGAQTAQGAVSADLLERFNASLADWRWGSLLGALQELLAVDTPIRRHWCAELMEEVRKKKRKKEGEGAAEQEAQAEPRDQTSQPHSIYQARGPALPGGAQAASAPAAGAKEDEVDVKQVSSAILDASFWAYCCELSLVQTSQACPCLLGWASGCFLAPASCLVF